MNYIECIFISEMKETQKPSPMTDVFYFNPDSVIAHIATQMQKGITHFLLFGVPKVKSVERGCQETAIVPQTIRTIKQRFGNNITLYADVGLSPYREDGHSTVITNGEIDENESYIQASKLAVAFAKAGADYVAPCLSLPDQVAHIKNAVAKYPTKVMAYSSKYSSSLYGPYRDTIESPLGKVKKTYQTDQSDAEEGLQQLQLDEAQGASIVMVKPATFYLDIVAKAKSYTSLPLAVYHVSGEYMMLKVAATHDIIEESEAFDEIHTAFARNTVDFIIGYAPDHFLRRKSQNN